MSREQITLKAQDAEWFREIKEEIGKRRGEAAPDPGNAQTVRHLMRFYNEQSSSVQ